MLRLFMICRMSLAPKNFSRSSVRNFSSQVKTRIEKPASNEIGFATRSREEFERAFPKLAAKQEHHLRMLKVHKLPVHRSGGPANDFANSVFYASAAILFVLFMYAYYDMIAKS